MSKIIIHNNSRSSDATALWVVNSVVANGFVSGKNQYCWLSQFINVEVHAKKTRGTTHTFEVRDL